MRYQKQSARKYPQHPFNCKLRAVAQHIKHRDLAKKLGVTTYAIINWLYHNVPNKYALEKMMPKLEKIQADLKKAA